MEDRVTAPELDQFIVEGVELTGNLLGVGAYGAVEEVLIPGAKVAAKKLHHQLIDFGSPEQVHKWISDFVEECKLMSQLRHPHVVQFLGICYLPGSHLPVLLMEELQTSLDSLLETTPNIPLDVKVYLLTGTGRGVVYLHSRNPPVIHRDLTARNILVDSGLTAKIADLGVARMVNIQPGQRAATMTQGPGNGLYMPPEATPAGEEATRYNTSIDIFSFGVVGLFTLTQTFPKDILPGTYCDPVSKRVLGRTEIERRQMYIELMKASLGEDHPLVKMTLDCLEYLPEDRPSAEEVLTQLEEVGSTIPQQCTETKLELIQQIQQAKEDHEAKVMEKDGQISQLQATVDHLQADSDLCQVDPVQVTELQATVSRLQTDNNDLQAANDRLQTVKREQVHGVEDYRAQLSEKCTEISQLQATKVQLQSTVDLLQAANDYLLTEKEEQREQNQQAEDTQGEQQAQISHLRTTIHRLQAERQQHLQQADELSVLQATVNRLQIANDQLHAEKQEHALGEHELFAKDLQISGLQESNNQLQTDLQHQAERQEQVRNEHRAQLHQLEARVARLAGDKSDLQVSIDRLQQVRKGHQSRIIELQDTVDTLKAKKSNIHAQSGVSELQTTIGRLQAEKSELQAAKDRLQDDKQEQIDGLEELATLQQQRLKVQRREIERLSSQLRSLPLEGTVHRHQPQAKPAAGAVHHKSHTWKPPSLLFNWTRCRCLPETGLHSVGMFYPPTLPLNGKLYIRILSSTSGEEGVLQFTPHSDPMHSWHDLPLPPVKFFSIASLKGQLLAVGGYTKSSRRISYKIHAYNKLYSPPWVMPYPTMPIALSNPTVIGYQDHLIIAGGFNSGDVQIADVNILNTSTNKWITAEPLPIKDTYRPVLIEDTVYLVGEKTKSVLRAHVPTLISRATGAVWETLPNSPFYRSNPVAIDNTLLAVGGRDSYGKHMSSIHTYNPTKNQWTRVGDLPEPILKFTYTECMCSILPSGELLVIGMHEAYKAKLK